MFDRLLVILGLVVLVALTWVVSVFHLSVYPAPPEERRVERPEVTAKAKFLGRDVAGVNSLVVFGNPYERGLASGRLTKGLIEEEERALVSELERFFPNPVLRHGLMVLAMRWFWGVEKFLAPRHTDEMYGVAQSASPAFDYLTDGFTRQLAYHGVHEVGQMFVDFERQDFGCTLLGVARPAGWLIGRNFDFEAVRLLDTEKILKWSFPDEGNAYVAVTWAGMVGVVTGVNEHGIYVSINAAGSSDFRRFGTPTTLVVLKALEEAKTPEEAVKIVEDAKTFITDLFVVAGPGTGPAYVIEKTPLRHATFKLAEGFAVSNHLRSPAFADDPINAFRMREQTTVARQERANELVLEMTSMFRSPREPRERAEAMVAALRDKRGPHAALRHLGHRSTLDALIATHSVVYDGETRTLFVSKGPALSGPYVAFDLPGSFKAKAPVPEGRVGAIPADVEVDAATFQSYQEGMGILKKIKLGMKANDCAAVEQGIAAIGATPAREHYEFLMALGDYVECCEQDPAGARVYWTHALQKEPAYLRHRQELERRLR